MGYWDPHIQGLINSYGVKPKNVSIRHRCPYAGICMGEKRIPETNFANGAERTTSADLQSLVRGGPNLTCFFKLMRG